ncbi:MAG: PVC-type heme-binding CxxCH protein [Bacteroidota bacterium]
MQKTIVSIFTILLISILLIQCAPESKPILSLKKETHIVLIGNNLCSRMMNFGYFETELHARFPDSNLFIRNMCDGGNTPGFRPHSGRISPWAFLGAEIFQSEMANNSNSQGHFETEDEWLTRLKTDIIIACFGFNESFQGTTGLRNYRTELTAFIKHTFKQKYNGKTAPQLVIVSPTAYQDLSDKYDLPNGKKENNNLQLYSDAMQEVCDSLGVHFIDAFSPSQKWFTNNKRLTIDGYQLNKDGYQLFSQLLADRIFGTNKIKAKNKKGIIREAVLEKNWYWHNDFKIPNGVHVFGRRFDPFGPDNYPFELKKIREMTANRDRAIWAVAKGENFNLTEADKNTTELPPVESNYKPGDYGRGEGYLYGQDALNKIYTAPGYKIELFASEKEFPDLANPVQLSFDNQGRLWVAVMPTYPHWKPGDPKPNDKLLILEDTDNDGKADKQTVWAEGLHIPVGFEFAPEGVYVSQGTNLKLFTDTDGDDKADQEEIIYSGFDDHDTHHVISAFCADPSGAIYMGEGVFLHTNVETPYGPVRATNGGFFRFAPQRRHLERTAQMHIPNPWGIAFDEWGQNIFAETSGPAVRWMMPSSGKPRYGVGNPKSFELVEDDHKVRPTSGLEFVSSRHFPDDVQGDLLINNTIGFLGMKQHRVLDDSTGYQFRFRHDLFWSDDKNFRPVDMEFAPDGSLYVIDWHNVLIGHMQHNARDPYRDHVHGRVYRVTYPERPLVEPANVAGASIDELLENLKLPEYRTRYRTQRELRGRNTEKVLAALKTWVANLDEENPEFERLQLEALWVTWGLNKVDQELIHKLLRANDFRVRAATVRVLRYAGHQMKDQALFLREAARDGHGRVRLEAITAASWLERDEAMPILNEAAKHPLDRWMKPAYETAVAHVNGRSVHEKMEEPNADHLAGAALEQFKKGHAIFNRDGYCATCHQANGRGLKSSGYPPLVGTDWALGDEERLIKLTLKGLIGPIKVLDVDYPGTVPMTPYEGLMNDEEIAAVLTYVRNAFGNKASVISPEQVKEVRASVEGKEGFYRPEELMRLQ